jgi:hypothetical protein
MIEIKITGVSSINKRLSAIQTKLRALPKEAEKEYVALTPIRSGRARRSTKLQGDTIMANYPYAGKLDHGSSKQAPEGMTKPFLKWLRARIKKIVTGK